MAASPTGMNSPGAGNVLNFTLSGFYKKGLFLRGVENMAG